MKKTLSLFLAVAFAFVLISCAEQGGPTVSTGDDTASSPTSVPTSPSVSGESETTQTTVSGEAETTQTSATVSSTTGRYGEIGTTILDTHIDGSPLIGYVYPEFVARPENGIDPREIKFQTFFEYQPDIPWEEQINDSKGWPSHGTYFRKSSVKGYFSGWRKDGFVGDWDPLIATVISYDKNQRRMSPSGIMYSWYYVTFTSYSGEKNDTVFMMNAVGCVDQPYYNRPMLIPGKRYLRLLPCGIDTLKEVEEQQMINDSVLFLIEEQDGVEYVYGIGVDLSGMDCAIPITDPYENAVYKPGIDDDIIAFMEEHGIPVPTYDYKCELHAFVKEMNDDID